MTDSSKNEDQTTGFERYNKKLKIISYGILTSIILVFVGINFTDLPSFEDLENPKYDLASVIYDVHGTSFGRYYIEDRVALEYDQLSPNIKKALIATEDYRFYSHTGVDIRALARVGFKTVILRQDGAGGAFGR